jgi:polyisoprenyl-teichoic acid--peptidoglycan teichoic acid transferase
MKKIKSFHLVKISALILLSMIIVMSSIGFLVIHTYIQKMNLITDNSKNKITEYDISEGEIQEAVTEVTPDITNSPQNVISALDQEIHQNTEDKQVIQSKDIYNILLIGCDSRQAGGLGRSDAMIILSINTRNKKIVLTSLLRDIYLKIQDHNNNRLNAAYAYGGADLLIHTIEENFKIDIDTYLSIDFYAFIDVVDFINGVTLEVTEEDIPIINYYIEEINLHNGEEESNDLLIQAGSHILNGKQTLGYVRNRYNGTDFKRTARQRIVLEQIFNKIKDLNLIELKKLSDSVLPQVTTNLSESKMISLLLSFPIYKDYEIVQWSIPMVDTYSFLTINHMSVIQIDFTKNLEELHKVVYE